MSYLTKNEKRIFGENLPSEIIYQVSGGGDYKYASSQCQGWRPSMEDRIISKPGLFAIFDGHGGDQVSEYAMNNFERVFRENDGDLENTYLKLD